MLVPSLEQTEKYLGHLGTLAFVILGSILILASTSPRVDDLFDRLGDRRAAWLAAATLFAVIAVFAFVYPYANAGLVGGGSDLDDELNLAGEALLTGNSPYGLATYLRCPVDLFPGSLLLATPFVLLGNSAYQSFFWLAVFFFIVAVELGSTRAALKVSWVVLLCCPSLWHQIVTGGDHYANAIFVLAPIVVLDRVPSDRPVGRTAYGAAALLGIAVASRANFGLVLPLVLSMLLKRQGWRRALPLLVVTGAAAVAVTLPFYLADPYGFTPLQQTRTAGLVDRGLPLAQTVMPIVAASLALALSVSSKLHGQALFARIAVVQLFPVVWVVIQHSLVTGQLALANTGYAAFALPFAALAWATRPN
ncbi:MAG: hypothetical protein HY903_20670 [Deltaproteobacteria bacterium]|nr:hypothetical protein [Deltaproteobacteria bacterium]